MWQQVKWEKSVNVYWVWLATKGFFIGWLKWMVRGDFHLQIQTTELSLEHYNKKTVLKLRNYSCLHSRWYFSVCKLLWITGFGYVYWMNDGWIVFTVYTFQILILCTYSFVVGLFSKHFQKVKMRVIIYIEWEW